MVEAREIASWLKDAGAGRVNPRPDQDGEPAPSLSFLEPALGFSVTGYAEDEVELRVFFTAEAAPPWLREADPHGARHIVAIRVRCDQVLAAAETWRRELDDLPARPWAEAG
ncbi:hypothetical protein ACFFWC_23345 [Plantactinospora siamensis]|uniref:Uncharacterized protein n=1 Tax=Plantactinospora siamensis TaxID=555372 RepID=A0ABV6NUC6_9ACTN